MLCDQTGLAARPNFLLLPWRFLVVPGRELGSARRYHGAMIRSTLIAVCSVILIASHSTVVTAAEVDYLRDVKPILKTRCYACHGAIKQEAGLRLDTVAMMRQGGDSGSVLSEDGAIECLLLERISSTEEYERMPPEGEPLSPEQLRTVRVWLRSGAIGPRDEAPQADPQAHWAYQPIRSIDPPGDGHPVDAFIDRRLNELSLKRSPAADRVSLIRRVYLDLHGLPPTPAQVTIHEESTSDLIDQLLASPRYGERWAQHWLDIVRYADTHGYEVNTPRPNAWPYRDYVIRAFNIDKPYDQFIREQLAGDTLGEDAATGFMVAAAALLPGQIGADEESKRQARQDELDEIIVGTTATFLGMTVGCARCHDHKFDPVPQEDYYAFQAFFSGVEYGDRELRDAEFDQRQQELQDVETQIASLNEQLSEYTPLSFTGRTIIIDDEDSDRVTLLAKKNGHGTNPDGTGQGYRNDKGSVDRFGNLSGGRYTWWNNNPGTDVFTWNPSTAGTFRIWVSWGVHGSGVHTRDARYVLDQDGDLATTNDQHEIARADQYYFAGQTEGESEKKPLWSGLADTGVHQLAESTRLILRGGDTGTGITADVIILQETTDAEASQHTAGRLPQLRGAVNATGTEERFDPVTAKYVRFISHRTIDNDRHEPCIDELEVFDANDATSNVALASRGTVATSSGNYSNSGRHQLKHINDGKYGNSYSWISNQAGKGWVQLKFAKPQTISRVVWARDREGRFKDRLAVDYQITTSLDGTTWTTVSSSNDRLSIGTPHDDITAIVRRNRSTRNADIAGMASELEGLRKRQKELSNPPMVFAGKFREPTTTFVLNRGDPEQPVEEVTPHVLTSIGSISLPADADDRSRRRTLADWIASTENPLTARVMVNRIWQHHFGMGLVDTPSDFGMNGSPPTHADLLDWLASEFIRSGWSIKHMHRVIMSSQTYQQTSAMDENISSSTTDPRLVDGSNRLLWHFPSRRLEAEAIRDCILAVSGQLNLKMGGPGFDFFKTRGGLSGFPPVEEFTADELRRMIYAHKIRMEPVPVFGAFDCPDAGLPAPRRSQSTTAIQALNLLNSPFVIDQADALAARVATEAPDSIDDQIDLTFRLTMGRSPRPDEEAVVTQTVRTHGLATLCRAIFNSSEFLFIP